MKFAIISFLAVILIELIFSANIIRTTSFRKAEFRTRYKDKVTSHTHYKAIVVGTVHECVDLCLADEQCKTFNFKYDPQSSGEQSSENCQFVSVDINDNPSYQDKIGWKSYDTGRNQLSRLFNRETGYCWVPQSKSCTPSNGEYLILSNTDCEGIEAWFRFDRDEGKLFHYCSGIALCPNSWSTPSTTLVITHGCNSVYSDSYRKLWKRTWGKFQQRAKMFLQNNFMLNFCTVFWLSYRRTF